MYVTTIGEMCDTDKQQQQNSLKIEGWKTLRFFKAFQNLQDFGTLC